MFYFVFMCVSLSRYVCANVSLCVLVFPCLRVFMCKIVCKIVCVKASEYV